MPTSRRTSSRPSNRTGASRRPTSRTGSRPPASVTRRRQETPPTTKREREVDSGDSHNQQPVRARPSLTGRAAVLALVIAVLLVSYAYPLRAWYEQHSETSELRQEADQLRDSVQNLEKELRLWADPAYVAARARERLGFVAPGDKSYVVVPDGEAPEGPIVDADGLPPASDGNWRERLWTSVRVSDSR